METTQATIENVFIKSLNDGRSLYRTVTDGREYTTFKKELAEAAKALVNQEAVIGYTFKEGKAKEGGGQWPPNYFLESVTPVAVSSNGSGFAVDPAGGERELRIMRQSALARALETLPYFTAAEQTRETIAVLCEEYLSFFLSGNWESAQTMGAGDPDDDIPF